MACDNQMHQTIILTQTESDDEEIDVITVDVNEETFSQDLEFDFLNKIELEIDSDSDEFIDVVTVSPTKHTSSKTQVNRNAVNESRLTPSQATVNGLSKTKLNNDSEEQCFTMKTSKRVIDELVNDNDWDNEILRKYTLKRRNVAKKGNDQKTRKTTSVFRKALVKSGQINDDITNPTRKRQTRKGSKNEETSKGFVGTIDVTKLKSSVKIILSKTDVHRHNIDSGKVKSTKKNLRKTVSQTSTSSKSSRLSVDKRSKRINNHQSEDLGKRAALDKGQALLKPKRKCTRKSVENN